ncbi:MAG: AraC family transcriptional regulator [Calditrichota bacterium]
MTVRIPIFFPMNLTQQLIFLFSGLGAINGLLLSGYFLLLKSEKRLSDYFLGGLLLMISIRITKSIFIFFNPNFFKLFVHVGLSACLLIGPFLYLYILNATKPHNNLRKTWWLYLLPFLPIIGWLEYTYPYSGELNNWRHFVGHIYSVWGICILASGYHLRHILKKLWFNKEKSSDEEVWLLNIFIGVAIVYIAYETVAYTSYIVGALSFSFVFYISLLLWLFQRNRRQIASDPLIKYANSSLTTEAAENTMQRLSKVMERDKLYLDPELTLASLSEKLGLPSKELSQAINQMSGKNYSNYIADLRVDEAKRLLVSQEHQHFKIAAIAYDSGFNSLSSFNAVFKKHTGFTPNEYRKKS